jgi:hypothetical protein
MPHFDLIRNGEIIGSVYVTSTAKLKPLLNLGLEVKPVARQARPQQRDDEEMKL